MKKKIFIISGSSILLILLAVWFFFLRSDNLNYITVRPTHGQFRVNVTTSGELRAKKSIDIMGPTGIASVEIYEMKISKLVPEGTVVDSGAFVAELDRTAIMGKIKDIQLSIKKFESEYQLKELDSTQDLATARDELENITFSLEEKKLQKELSVYEAPSIQRQADIDYERSQRSYNQSLKNYSTKVKKAITNLTLVGTDLSREQQKLEKLMKIMEAFTINAPAPGMVIYARDWDGRRKEVGSIIRYWNPVVATLPDLTSMETVTYVSEIDIQKIKNDMSVNISLDANSSKKLTGSIVRVANIGESRQNSDSKVFEVVIKINESDTTLRPSMTTSNEILVQTVDDAVYIPLECIHSEQVGSESLNYVYKKSDGSIIKQQVLLGLINENEAIIDKGIKENDEILLSVPEKNKELTLNRLD
jgi:multidrug resistance efflux pump